MLKARHSLHFESRPCHNCVLGRFSGKGPHRSEPCVSQEATQIGRGSAGAVMTLPSAAQTDLWQASQREAKRSRQSRRATAQPPMGLSGVAPSCRGCGLATPRGRAEAGACFSTRSGTRGARDLSAATSSPHYVLQRCAPLHAARLARISRALRSPGWLSAGSGRTLSGCISSTAAARTALRRRRASFRGGLTHAPNPHPPQPLLAPPFTVGGSPAFAPDAPFPIAYISS